MGEGNANGHDRHDLDLVPRHTGELAMILPERHRQREYGKCTSCGGPLGEIRLKLMPTAELCASCQKAEDARLFAKRTPGIKDATR